MDSPCKAKQPTMDKTAKMMDTQQDQKPGCRMYRNKYPAPNDYVMIRVERIDPDVGVFVSLLEYNDIEGLVLLSDVSNTRMRSLKNHVQIGKQEPMQVLRVNLEKGAIVFLTLYL